MNPAHPDTLRGFIATLRDAHIEADADGVSWSLKPYAFLSDKAPQTVNPNLWRMAQLNAVHGLFKVTDRVYQVRGFSLANVTFVEGDEGVIVIDPLQFSAVPMRRRHPRRRHHEQFRLLGVMDSKRLPQAPDAPTFKGQGYIFEAPLEAGQAMKHAAAAAGQAWRS